ncbi:hypothetical protein ON010_g14177 [Phytophthora cinnamomi]|nr:hypothetical protein ON010_g14177 [Phytophthora cinnamomi]
MGKERFIPSPFGELLLSDADKVALKDFAYNFFDQQVAKYEDFIADGGPKVNERDWKYMKSKEGTRVYVERNPIVRESQMGSKTTDYPALLMTGTTWGTVDDCMFGAVATTTEAMRVKASGGALPVADGAVDRAGPAVRVDAPDQKPRLRVRRVHEHGPPVERRPHRLPDLPLGQLPADRGDPRPRARQHDGVRHLPANRPRPRRGVRLGYRGPGRRHDQDTRGAQHGYGLPDHPQVRALQRDEEDHMAVAETQRRAERVGRSTEPAAGVRHVHCVDLQGQRHPQARPVVQAVRRLSVPLLSGAAEGGDRRRRRLPGPAQGDVLRSLPAAGAADESAGHRQGRVKVSMAAVNNVQHLKVEPAPSCRLVDWGTNTALNSGPRNDALMLAPGIGLKSLHFRGQMPPQRHAIDGDGEPGAFHELRSPREASTHESTEDKASPLDSANVLSVATIWWLQPLLARGYRAPLTEDSVWDLPKKDQSRRLQGRFDDSWTRQDLKLKTKSKKHKRPQRQRGAVGCHQGQDRRGHGALHAQRHAHAGAALPDQGHPREPRGRGQHVRHLVGLWARRVPGLRGLLRRHSDQFSPVLDRKSRLQRPHGRDQQCFPENTEAERDGETRDEQRGGRHARGGGQRAGHGGLHHRAVVHHLADHPGRGVHLDRDANGCLRGAGGRCHERGHHVRGLHDVQAHRHLPTADLQDQREPGQAHERGAARHPRYQVLRVGRLDQRDDPADPRRGSGAHAEVQLSAPDQRRAHVSRAHNLEHGLLPGVHPSGQHTGRRDGHDKAVVSFQDADFQWIEDTPAPTLSNITFTLKAGTLTVVVGPVGSGKSSLVNAILGEMHQLRGTREVRGDVAYASQQAWIQNLTVRDNILFGEPYDAEHYNRVVTACQLLPDFEMLEQADQTEIGERGINLSGGQKARVGVARAMYRARKFDFVVLDDPLSALDVHVANAVFSDGLMGIAQGTTRFLVLNSHYHLLQYADRVLVMSDGQIVGDGTLEQLKGEFSFLATSPRGKTVAVLEETDQGEAKQQGKQQRSIEATLSKDEGGDAKKSKAPKKLIVEEDRRVGSVRMKTYVNYLAASEWNGYVLTATIFILFTVAQVSLFFCDWFLSQWSKGAVDLSQKNAMTVYVGIVVASLILTFIRYVVGVYRVRRCGSDLSVICEGAQALGQYLTLSVLKLGVGDDFWHRNSTVVQDGRTVFLPLRTAPEQ